MSGTYRSYGLMTAISFGYLIIITAHWIKLEKIYIHVYKSLCEIRCNYENNV